MEQGREELEPRQRRKAENEALFRKVNEELETLNEAFGSITGTFAVVCECDDIECTEQVEVDRARYEEVRSDPTLFIVVRGHNDESVEDVVGDADGWQIVRKRPGAPAEFAAATDPRAP